MKNKAVITRGQRIIPYDAKSSENCLDAYLKLEIQNGRSDAIFFGRIDELTIRGMGSRLATYSLEKNSIFEIRDKMGSTEHFVANSDAELVGIEMVLQGVTEYSLLYKFPNPERKTDVPYTTSSKKAEEVFEERLRQVLNNPAGAIPDFNFEGAKQLRSLGI